METQQSPALPLDLGGPRLDDFGPNGCPTSIADVDEAHGLLFVANQSLVLGYRLEELVHAFRPHLQPASNSGDDAAAASPTPATAPAATEPRAAVQTERPADETQSHSPPGESGPGLLAYAVRLDVGQQINRLRCVKVRGRAAVLVVTAGGRGMLIDTALAAAAVESDAKAASVVLLDNGAQNSTWGAAAAGDFAVLSANSHRVSLFELPEDSGREGSAVLPRQADAVGVGHTENIPDVEISPSGRFVASASHDTFVNIWSVRKRFLAARERPREAQAGGVRLLDRAPAGEFMELVRTGQDSAARGSSGSVSAEELDAALATIPAPEAAAAARGVPAPSVCNWDLDIHTQIPMPLAQVPAPNPRLPWLVRWVDVAQVATIVAFRSDFSKRYQSALHLPEQPQAPVAEDEEPAAALPAGWQGAPSTPLPFQVFMEEVLPCFSLREALCLASRLSKATLALLEERIAPWALRFGAANKLDPSAFIRAGVEYAAGTARERRADGRQPSRAHSTGDEVIVASSGGSVRLIEWRGYHGRREGDVVVAPPRGDPAILARHGLQDMPWSSIDCRVDMCCTLPRLSVLCFASKTSVKVYCCIVVRVYGTMQLRFAPMAPTAAPSSATAGEVYVLGLAAAWNEELQAYIVTVIRSDGTAAAFTVDAERVAATLAETCRQEVDATDQRDFEAEYGASLFEPQPYIYNPFRHQNFGGFGFHRAVIAMRERSRVYRALAETDEDLLIGDLDDDALMEMELGIAGDMRRDRPRLEESEDEEEEDY